ncbi:AIR synthase family protein [Haloprofundus sp. MHR1]|uniref:AIR synthase family protein n=1 Tax=Haloprofundus sp. MHR1 TaxID=2572921 RepID=UPI0010BEF176|nr:AIR synthase family protein [Haloprofundus sp. MHR1]QCJ48167.1 hydrogenase expression protein [Haloprofundus sp. MHR1]
MSDLGKIDPEFFDEFLYPRLGATRDDVALGPKHGVDFGMLDVDGTAVVLATDPLSVLPDLGFERAGRFALHIVLSDVAVSGLAPSHLAISFSLPPEMSDREFAELWAAIDDEAEKLGIGIVTGHTARYTGCSFPWVGAATALAVGDHDDVVRPDGARPGDVVLVTKGPAVEATGLLTTLFGDRMALPEETLDEARNRLDETRTVRDTRAIVDAVDASGAGDDSGDATDVGGVTAMHDATEGGLQGALCEVAGSAGVRLDVERDAVPLRPGVAETCEYLDIDPWHATSSGTLVVTVAESAVDDVVSALQARGTPVGVAGTVSAGEGVYLDGERVEHPRVDPSWAVYEAFAEGESD